VLVGNRLSTRTRDLATDAIGLVTLLIAGLSAEAVNDPAPAAKVGPHAPFPVGRAGRDHGVPERGTGVSVPGTGVPAPGAVTGSRPAVADSQARRPARST